MDREKFNAVLGYFSDQNIEVPTDVKNAIEDVFMENDDISSVECYHKEDLEQFQDDLSLTNNVMLFLNGSNTGTTNNIWTYYGSMSYSLNEQIKLYDSDGETELEDISTVFTEESTIVEIPTEWVVVVHELVNWDTNISEDKKLKRELKLYIYCPIASEPEEDDEYSEIYNEIKNNEEL